MGEVTTAKRNNPSKPGGHSDGTDVYMNAEDAERRRYLDPRSTKRHARLLNPLPDPPAGQAWDAKIATRKQARRSGRATTERRTKENLLKARDRGFEDLQRGGGMLRRR